MFSLPEISAEIKDFFEKFDICKKGPDLKSAKICPRQI